MTHTRMTRRQLLAGAASLAAASPFLPRPALA